MAIAATGLLFVRRLNRTFDERTRSNRDGRTPEELAYADQRVSAAQLDGSGHRFRHPSLEGALGHVLGRR